MLISDDDAVLLKKWIVKRLEDISDADSDVLADYVLALVRSEDSDEQVKVNCLENLEDFLRDHTGSFVDDVFNTIRTKSYLPEDASSAPQETQAESQPFNPPSGPANDQSRKRTWGDRAGSEQRDGPDSHYSRGTGGERAIKQMRRGNYQGGGGRGGRHGDMSIAGFPQVDPNNPMSAIMAMQALGFPPLPGMPQLPMGAPNNFGQKYDPKNASIDTDRRANGHSDRRHHDRSRGGRGRGRGDSGRRGGRAHFSQAGPNHDRSITTIVIENIPEEKFSEDAVREFFSEFGNIEEITMHGYKRLAMVKYDDYSSARKAYDSPKVIFDNRFVKVYWYKPDQHSDVNGSNGRRSTEGVKKEEEEMIDMEEIKRRQEEAQKAHEEKQQKLREAEAKKAELDAKIKAQAEERKKLLEKLAAKSANKKTEAPSSPTIKGGDADVKSDASSSIGANGSSESRTPGSQTEALRLKLAQLEAEAESMGLNPNDPGYGTSTSYRGRGGRGASRGRGSWAPRGRGGYDPSYRGGYRGRGGYGMPRGGAVKRLDFRPRRVVAKIGNGEEEWTPDRDEALRSHLFNNFEFDSIDTYPEGGKNAMVIAFKERYIAENFIAQSQEIPSIGRVQLSWAPNPPNANNQQLQQGVSSKPESVADGDSGEDVSMGEAGAGAVSSSAGVGGGAEEFDVADDEDRWMAA
ncbi:CCCH zinc finger and RRM domain-containing protein [Lasiodiplodia theobromae]|uniref:CCCH zinc finger and RRM domain-containing protein n=1 Tax=Lasiodiplodia theobromae TaxID=45133 RepID=UPI0015C3D136|nr:CCCH zinc finger and RRM domain-containing protein [Lasiodiplodia theobromae]KAF4538014.1 CCCH zinc finger and RRM domain-containing protein [Lasiodiplodia theobromae]